MERRKNIRLLAAYDGTHYLGWQKTTTGPSIESELKKAIEQIFQEPVTLQAASRTDRGVHAFGQVVNFFLECPQIEVKKALRGLNALLPSDIAIRKIEQAETSFHPTLDVKSKIYIYDICFGKVQLPMHRHYSWHYPYPLDIKLMQQAASLLEGRHDFNAFCNQKKNEGYQDHVRTVDCICIQLKGKDRLRISIQGEHFLYKMARNLVGSLVYVGCGKIKLEELNNILNCKDRRLNGVTAPAHGLFLEKVNYAFF